MSSRHIAWIVAGIALLTTACAPTLFYQVRQTRTYEYEQRVPVLVESSPTGATIVAADGRVLGEAPLIVEETVRVRREHRYCSSCMAIVGCAVDVTASAISVSYANDHPDSGWAQAAGYVGVGMLLGCVSLSFAKLINAFALGLVGPLQGRSFSFLSTQPTDHSVFIPRSIDLVARWDGLGDARARLVLPGTRTVTLRLPRRYTFDEAVVMWVQQTSPALTAESLFAVASAYLGIARRGVTTARDQARRYFSIYLQRYPEGDEVEAARHGLVEVAELEAKAK